ncbi:MAG: 3'(2'),5'-bisphosphate nucleotidase CysQ [Pyrinomonadaceae bacterium]|nr:3'(2'),5'-bisphosphate nucleotidase CysQ [Pyrinomonadaceae bacterium]MCX7640109.1 3'(2'),5'-bisphosphate nucleotidase CysQ [Pyrinomonadaceae bacterium]MDW8303303.1 3'(2'),5'-bisphosphate nucleotidase CysQ [Acidobacteriota bacterium]
MLDKELEVATQLAIQAGEEIMELFEKGFEVQQKKLSENFSEPVTSADKRAGEIIVEGLSKYFPEDGILSEELEDNLERLKKQRVWIIDPIDGTKGFVEKSRDFAVQIGLVSNGRPILGVVYQPAEKRLFFACKNKGAFLVEKEQKPKELRVNETQNIEDMTLAVSRMHRSPKITEIVSRLKLKKEIAHGSVGLKIGLVAEGKADLYIHLSPHTKLWDTCAPQIILEEANGILTDLFGEEINYCRKDTQNYNGILATNKKAHKVVLDRLKPILNQLGRIKLKEKTQ